MSEILDFLASYWKLIALAVLLILDLVLIVLNRRKPVKVFDSVHQVISAALPDLIKAAESSYCSGHGSEKLSMVKELVFNYLRSCYGMTTEEAMKYDDYIVKQVEAILSCPQKKGDL